MRRSLYYWIVLCCFCSAAMAQDLSTPKAARKAQRYQQKPPQSTEASSKNKWLFNFGTHTEFFNNVQNDTSGGTRKFDFAPTIGAGMLIPLSSYDLKFIPELNWVLPRKAGTSKIIKNLLMFRADLAYDPLEWLRLRLGTSLMWANQHGRGGSAKVSNGTGTSTFYYPDENRSSLNNTLDVGVEAMMEDWSLRLQTYTYSIFIEEKRQISYTLLISYYWDR